MAVNIAIGPIVGVGGDSRVIMELKRSETLSSSAVSAGGSTLSSLQTTSQDKITPSVPWAVSFTPSGQNIYVDVRGAADVSVTTDNSNGQGKLVLDGQVLDLTFKTGQRIKVIQATL